LGDAAVAGAGSVFFLADFLRAGLGDREDRRGDLEVDLREAFLGMHSGRHAAKLRKVLVLEQLVSQLLIQLMQAIALLS
jgi:hypothetical protein